MTSASTGEMLLQVVFGTVRTVFLHLELKSAARESLSRRHCGRLSLQVIHSQGSFRFLLCCTAATVMAFCLFLLFLYVQHAHRSSHTGETVCCCCMVANIP